MYSSSFAAGSPDVRAVAGAQHLEVERPEPPQRVEVGGQRALAGAMKTLPSPSTVSPVKQTRPIRRHTLSAE